MVDECSQCSEGIYVEANMAKRKIVLDPLRLKLSSGTRCVGYAWMLQKSCKEGEEFIHIVEDPAT